MRNVAYSFIHLGAVVGIKEPPEHQSEARISRKNISSKYGYNFVRLDFPHSLDT